MACFDHLTDDCLLLVLDLLSPEQLFKMLYVNQRLRRLATDRLRVQVKVIRLWAPKKEPDCSHLGVLTPDQELSVVLAMEASSVCNSRSILESLIRDGPKTDPGKAFLLDLFSRCANVKRVSFELPGDLLLEVVRLCPQIECLKLCRSMVKEEELNQALDVIGPKIIHVVEEAMLLNKTPEAWPLEVIAKKCPNIKQIDLQLFSGKLTRNFMEAVKQLPNTCQVNIHCQSLPNDSEYEDVIDNLEVSHLPSVFCERTERLASLKLKMFRFGPVEGRVLSVDFAGLKRLDISACKEYNNPNSGYLIVSRFSVLEEFCFNTALCQREIDYESVFENMPMIKKLTIACETGFRLPQTAIRVLRRLETIEFKMKRVPPEDRRQIELLKLIEWYVDAVDLLRRVVVETIHSCDKDNWRGPFRQGIRRLKEEQSRVEVEFLL